MSAVAAVVNIDNTLNQFIVRGTVTLTGNYGTGSSHGDTVDLSGLGVPSSSLPAYVTFTEQSPAGALPSGYTFRYMPGTTQANGVLNIMSSQSAEFSEGSAYGTPPFSVTGFKLCFEAQFPAFI